MGKDKCRINTKQALKDELISSEAIWQLSDSSIDDVIHKIELAAEWPPNTISKNLTNLLRTKVDGYFGYYYACEIFHKKSTQSVLRSLQFIYLCLQLGNPCILQRC